MKDLQFIATCLANKNLIELLFNDELPSVDEVIKIHRDDYSNLTNNRLFINIVELITRHDLYWSSEEGSYGILAKELNADITGSHGGSPDLITRDGTPVEVKKGDFNASALKQLERYMLKLRSSNGIAVGRNLTCKLPKNITFIKIAYNDDCHGWEILR